MHCGNLNDFLNPLFWYTLINSPTYGTNYLWSNAKGSIPMVKRKRSKMRQRVKQNWVKSVTKGITFHKDYFLKFFYVYKN